MIKFIKKNPAIPQRWIVLTALAYSLTAAQAGKRTRKTEENGKSIYQREYGIRHQTI